MGTVSWIISMPRLLSLPSPGRWSHDMCQSASAPCRYVLLLSQI